MENNPFDNEESKVVRDVETVHSRLSGGFAEKDYRHLSLVATIGAAQNLFRWAAVQKYIWPRLTGDQLRTGYKPVRYCST